MTCEHTVDVAAYVLDALEPVEAARVREHVVCCPDCRPEYDELRGLPNLLDRLTPSDVDDIVSPAELPDNLCEELLAKAAARRLRRNRRRMLGMTAAAAAVVAGVVAGITSPVVGHSDSTTVAATDPRTHVHADITLTARSFGTQIRLRLSGVAWAQQCMLVVSSTDGRRDVAATWVATYKGSADVTGTTAIPAERIRHFDVITTGGERLVSVPPPAH